MSGTVLDRAFRAMEAAPESTGPRLRFYERLADAALFVLLEEEAADRRMRPRVFPLEDGPLVLAFDREDRLAAFAEEAADHAEMSGRVLVPMLAEAGLGLGLNLGVAPSEIVLPPEALGWLAETLSARPAEVSDLPDALTVPTGAPRDLLQSLDAKMPGLAGLADHAVLAGAVRPGGAQGLVLAFVGAVRGAEPALAQAAGEALIFSGLEDGALDVTFTNPGSEAAERLARTGIRFDLPEAHAESAPRPPGTDPHRPPRLR